MTEARRPGMQSPFLWLALLLLPALPAIAGSAPPAESQPKTADPTVQKLVDRTLRELVFVPGGTFWMGDYVHGKYESEGEQWWTSQLDNKVQHQVTLDAFHIQKHEVTYGEYDVFTRATGRPLAQLEALKAHMPNRVPDRPAGVNWYQARDYCRWLGQVTGLPFDLPTEAQWEYAARSRGQWVGIANDTGYPDRGRNLAPFERYGHAVCQYPANPLGLCDMSGNALEWVRDWYAVDYYAYSPRHNPQGPKTGTKKILRGGSFIQGIREWTAYQRDKEEPGKIYHWQGFRCVVNLDRPLPQAIRPPDEATIRQRLTGALPPVYPPGSHNLPPEEIRYDD